MLNPFMQDLPRKRNGRVSKNESLAAEQKPVVVETFTRRPSAGLWLGKLLIRMGEKLAKQDVQWKGTKQSA